MNFDELKQQCLACQRCGLCETRTHVVFGQGVPDAEVLFVGEGPGANEDAQGLPFVGRSGQLLDHYLEAIDLDRSKIFILPILLSAARQKTATLPRKNPPPASVAAHAVPAAAPKNCGVLGPHCRPADDWKRLFRHAGPR